MLRSHSQASASLSNFLTTGIVFLRAVPRALRSYSRAISLFWVCEWSSCSLPSRAGAIHRSSVTVSTWWVSPTLQSFIHEIGSWNNRFKQLFEFGSLFASGRGIATAMPPAGPAVGASCPARSPLATARSRPRRPDRPPRRRRPRPARRDAATMGDVEGNDATAVRGSSRPMVSGYRIAIIPDPLGRTCGRQRPGGLHRLMCCRLAGCRRACISIQAVVASLRPCHGILPGCDRHRAGRLKPTVAASTRPFVVDLGGKGLFPPKPSFISSLFRGGIRPTKGRFGHPWPPAAPLVGGSEDRAHRRPGAASCLGGFRPCPPAGRRPAHPLRSGPVPILGNRPATASLFH